MSHINSVLLLGTNLGDKKKNLEDAIFFIEKEIGEVLKKTNIMETEPQEYESDNLFYNMAIEVRTNLSPILLLKTIKAIERKIGRLKDSIDESGYSDRLIDIDIIYFNSVRYHSIDLDIPHYKHVNQRNFSVKLLKELINC